METPKSPGDFIRDELAARGWTQDDLARILNRPRPTINRILIGKHAILPEMAIALAAAFGDSAEVWMARESAFQMSQANVDTAAVKRRAQLYDIAPVKEMERRGWIKPTPTADDLEQELKHFFGVTSFESEPAIGAATRKSDANDPLSPSQRAWCFRVRQLAASLVVPDYDPSQLDACKFAIRKLAAYPQEAHKVSSLLAKYGIRFVVVEPLTGAKVDGVAMWLDKKSPVIGLSIRYDRIDSFWFTLCHEISHIEHLDEAPLDADLTDNMEGVTTVRAQMERRANSDSAHLLVPRDDLESFIRRVGPLYSKEKIIKFANRVKMHPGVIVGQLQRRDEIGYSANREMLSKVRHFVVSAAVTDGWGRSIDQRSFE